MPEAAAPAEANVHATVVLAGDRGILIAGRSGAGKSTLALALIRACHEQGRFAILVADDRALLRAAGGRLVAAAPAPLAGLVEVHGLGPVATWHESRAVIDLVVRLVPAGDAPRFQDEAAEELLGSRLPRLDMVERNAASATAVIMAYLALPPFGRRANEHIAYVFCRPCGK